MQLSVLKFAVCTWHISGCLAMAQFFWGFYQCFSEPAVTYCHQATAQWHIKLSDEKTKSKIAFSHFSHYILGHKCFKMHFIWIPVLLCSNDCITQLSLTPFSIFSHLCSCKHYHWHNDFSCSYWICRERLCKHSREMLLHLFFFYFLVFPLADTDGWVHWLYYH